jgi:UDP-2,3-diacylglucosamine hydrolase
MTSPDCAVPPPSPPGAPVPARLAALDRLALRAPVFISDLHLTGARPRTVARFLALLDALPTRGAELLILGDLFEIWAGDDLLPAPRVAPADAADAVARDDQVARDVAQALRALGQRGIPVYLMHGNRDLLLGAGFLQASGAHLLADPCLAVVGAGGDAMPLLLSHGDAYCTLDLPYQAFRRQARDAQVQAGFLAQPLEARRAMLGQARLRSEAGKQQMAEQIMDVTPAAIDAALRAAGVRRLLHGHTHRPGRHDFLLDGEAAVRWVLPDWDLDGGAPRGGGLRWRGAALEAFGA